MKLDDAQAARQRLRMAAAHGDYDRRELLDEYAWLLECGYCGPGLLDDSMEWSGNGLAADQAAWVKMIEAMAAHDRLKVEHTFENAKGGLLPTHRTTPA